MKKHLILFAYLLFPYLVLAQISESFEDGDFTQNPQWLGDEAQFIVNDDFQLQLSNEGLSDTSYLVTSNSFIDSTSWEFSIKLSFSPSSNNNARVYLVSDQQDLSTPLNGYFLQFGESLSDDAIELFRQNGTEITSICRGTEGSVASSFQAKIKVIHKDNGDWIVYSDFNTTGQFQLECQGNDNSISSTAYFGYFCKYTSSNSTKFYLDNIEVKYMEVDIEKPEVEAVVLESSKDLKVSFNEMVTEETALSLSNYSVDQIVGNPILAELNEAKTEVLLQFENDFAVDQEYQITIENVEDLSGNIMDPTVESFARIEISPFDVVINEIMADPTPEIQLPNAEYLEIYNRTSTVIALQGWKMEIGGTLKDFPEAYIPANSYLIICKESNIPLLSGYGECVGFSSFSLTNGGQLLRLLSPSDMVVHEVEYTDDWYQDPNKDDGGWSLEQINPSDFCSQAINWRAAEDARGGSPGELNSIYDDTPAFPQVSNLEVVDNPLLLLSFNQEMDLQDILRKSNYSVQPGDNPIQQVIAKDTSTSVYLIFQDPFEIGENYQLIIDGDIKNCAGQSMETPSEIDFMIPKNAIEGDIVIHEIMADPEPVFGLPPYEYLELYNTSNAPIDLSGWTLQTGSTIKTFESYLLNPQSFLIICESDAVASFSEYGDTYAMSSFSLTNGGAQIVLRNLGGGIIHQIEYDDDWYEDDDKADGGWSLEAIDPLEYCVEKPNWSESIDEKGGSPGSINSVDGTMGETEPLRIQRIELISETNIRVYFSEKMDSISLSQTQNYFIDENIGNPIECAIEGPKYNSVVLTLAEELSNTIVYTLEIEDGLLECNGSSAGGLFLSFAVPDEIEKGDIVFNEILFDAAIDDGEYVELVNVSDKILETSGLSISRIKINQYDTTWYTADLESALLFPNDYIAYAESPSQVLRVYYSEQPEQILQLSDLPDFPSTEGHVLLHLTSSTDSIIDELQYTDGMHHSLLKETKGVSLEKISLLGGNVSDNWHSAASSVNYGTPAYQNSQFLEEGSSQSAFKLTPEVFSPDNDGYEDVLQINYRMKEAGFQLNLIVYDARGRQVNRLVKNELLGTEGNFYWNGEDENGEKASMGIYILLFEYFDLEGNVNSEKLSTVLGGKL